MLVYWSMFAIPALISFGEAHRTRAGSAAALPIFGAIVWILMAFRESGGDYTTYLELFGMIDGQPLPIALEESDPAYAFLNWCSSQLGFGLYGVNAVCAIIFLVGLLRFAREEPRPVLVLTVAMSYLVIVVAIGYTRQGTAVGLILLALTHIRGHRPFRAAGYIVLAALFHSTAAAAMPLVYFAVHARSGFGLWALRFALVASSLYAAWLIAQSNADYLYANYFGSDRYNSGGALIRSMMNGAAATIFFVYWRRWNILYGDRKIWLVFAVLSIISVPASFGGSTAVDRMGLYLIPLQLAAFGRLPTFLASGRAPEVAVSLVVACYAVSLFVWLHIGNFAAELWLPYRSAIFGAVY